MWKPVLLYMLAARFFHWHFDQLSKCISHVYVFRLRAVNFVQNKIKNNTRSFDTKMSLIKKTECIKTKNLKENMSARSVAYIYNIYILYISSIRFYHRNAHSLQYHTTATQHIDHIRETVIWTLFMKTVTRFRNLQFNLLTLRHNTCVTWGYGDI